MGPPPLTNGKVKRERGWEMGTGLKVPTLTWEGPQAGQGESGRPPVLPGTPTCPAAKGLVREERGGCGTVIEFYFPPTYFF